MYETSYQISRQSVFLSFGAIPLASGCYMPTFRNTQSFPGDGTGCSEMSAYTIQTPGNHPKERIQIIDLFTKGGKSDNNSNDLSLQRVTHTYIQYNIHVPPLLCWGGGWLSLNLPMQLTHYSNLIIMHMYYCTIHLCHRAIALCTKQFASNQTTVEHFNTINHIWLVP